MTGPVPIHPGLLLPWYVNGTLEGDELREVEEHLLGCLACRREVEELRALREDLEQQGPAPPSGGLERLLEAVEEERRRPRRGVPWAWRRPLAAAAAVAATLATVVGLVVWRPESAQAPPAQYRAGDEHDVVRSLMEPERALPRQAFVLRWEVDAPWRESLFSVAVTTEDLTPVAEAHGLDESSYQVPAEALATLPAGTRLFWRLEAERPDGARRSRVFAVRLE